MPAAAWPEHVQPLPATTGHRWVVGDVHGCARTLHQLASELALKPTDQLIFLGDLIDRGPDNRGVLDAVMHWQQQGLQGQGPQVFVLQGNHEWMLLDELQKARWADSDKYLALHARRQKCEDLLEPGRRGLQLPEPYHQWLEKLPLALVTEGWWLVHGSVNMSLPQPLDDDMALLWGRHTDEDAAKALNVRVVHGHTPTPLPAIEARVERKAHVVPLDAGAVFGKRVGLGHLAALNLNTWQLMYTPQIDGTVFTPPPQL